MTNRHGAPPTLHRAQRCENSVEMKRAYGVMERQNALW